MCFLLVNMSDFNLVEYIVVYVDLCFVDKYMMVCLN